MYPERRDGLLSPDSRGAAQLGGAQDFDAQPQPHQLIAKLAGQLSRIEQVGHSELEGQTEHVLKELCSLEVNQHRCVGDENWHLSSRHLVQSRVEFADGYAKQFRGAGFPDHAFGQRPVT